MATFKPALNRTLAVWLHSDLGFWILWVVASYAGAIFYVVPVMAVHLSLGLVQRGGGPDFPPGFAPGLRMLAAVLCGAACGSTIGLAHWLVLRTRLNQIGGWVAATIVGYASLGLWPLVADLFEPGWMEWAFTLIVNGKMYWLARLEPTWPEASWLPGAVTYLLFGATLGTLQWLVLRRRVHRAGWWIAINTIAWALGAGLVLLPSTLISTRDLVIGVFALPYAVSGAGMVWLMRRSGNASTPEIRVPGTTSQGV